MNGAVEFDADRRPQALFGAAIAGVKIMELSASVTHAADLDDAALEQRYVAGVVITYQLLGPANQERPCGYAAGVGAGAFGWASRPAPLLKPLTIKYGARAARGAGVQRGSLSPTQLTQRIRIPERACRPHRTIVLLLPAEPAR